MYLLVSGSGYWLLGRRQMADGRLSGVNTVSLPHQRLADDQPSPATEKKKPKDPKNPTLQSGLPEALIIIRHPFLVCRVRRPQTRRSTLVTDAIIRVHQSSLNLLTAFLSPSKRPSAQAHKHTQP